MKAIRICMLFVGIAIASFGVASDVAAAPEAMVSFSLADVAFSTREGFDLVEVQGCHLSGEPGQPLQTLGIPDIKGGMRAVVIKPHTVEPDLPGMGKLRMYPAEEPQGGIFGLHFKPLEDGKKQVFLAGEILVDGPFADLGSGRNVGDGRAGIPLLGKDADRSIDNAIFFIGSDLTARYQFWNLLDAKTDQSDCN